MASSLLDVCRFNPAAGGTADWTYSSAVTGYQSPAAAGAVNGAVYSYRAESNDLSQWEVGYGAYNSSTGVFSRTTVLFNSSGTTSKINFSTVPQVAIVALAEDLLLFNTAMSLADAQKAQGRSNIEAAPFDAASFNNIAINGGMEVDQVNAGASTTVAAAYAIDGWQVQKNGTMVCSAQQVADAPPGFTNSLKITVGTAEASIAAGDYIFIQQSVEGFRSSKLGFGAAAPQPITLGFWTKIHRTGAYSGAIQNFARTRSYPFSFTQNVADAWEYKTVTIAGDASGTWVGNTNAGALLVVFAVAAGSTFTSTAAAWASSNFLGATGTTNGVATTSDVFQITGVCLLPGTEATSAVRSPLIKRPYDQELRLCKRYLYVLTGFNVGQAIASGYAYNSSLALFPLLYPVAMRATPTLVLSAAGDVGVTYSAGTATGTGVALTANGGNSSRIDVTTAAVLGPTNGALMVANTTSLKLTFDARL